MISGISDRAVFAAIRTNGHHVRTADLRLRYLTTSADIELSPVPQVAYSISRKVGNAVVRNRIRRRLRSVFADQLGKHPSAPIRAAVVIVLPGARTRTFAELQDQVLELMKKVEKSTEAAS